MLYPESVSRQELMCTGADLNKAGVDLNQAGADVNKEIYFITSTSYPIDIKSIQEATMQDQDLNKLKDVIFKGWPKYRKQCPQELWDYWTFRCDLVIEDGLILKGDSHHHTRTTRVQVLEVLHTGHQGETKCLLLARESVFWPGITNGIKQLVKDCDICTNTRQSSPSYL